MENLEKFPAGLKEGLMPKHIAFILDGNRPWAVEKGWAPMVGHSAMRMALKPLLRKCSELKIKVVSLYAFSTENWSRPPVEVDFLMEMYEDLFRKDTEELLRFSLGCRVTLMGDKTKLPLSFQEISAEIEEKSRKNVGTHVNYAINYSGKYDIIQACRSIAMKVNDGVLIPNQIDETHFKHQLETKMTDFPYPDLLIRTSGEERLSNFMLWQMAYSEHYFTKKLFPDFGVNDLIEALITYQERRRQQSSNPTQCTTTCAAFGDEAKSPKIWRKTLKTKLLERCVSNGVKFHKAKVWKVCHKEFESSVVCDDGTELKASLIVDASGFTSSFVEYDKPRNHGYQIAHGILAEVDEHPFDLDKMLLMD
nr:dehydrodolichyl diphosphate synthase 2-like [Tanacetum cinerariifolium]